MTILNGGFSRLDNLPPGMVFVTRDGVLAVKSHYRQSPDSQWQCILLETGEYAHFDDGNDEEVLAITLSNPLDTKPGVVIGPPPDQDANAFALLWLLNKLDVNLWAGNDGSISWKWPADLQRAAPIIAILRLLHSCKPSMLSLLRHQGRHEVSPDLLHEIEGVLEKADDGGEGTF